MRIQPDRKKFTRSHPFLKKSTQYKNNVYMPTTYTHKNTKNTTQSNLYRTGNFKRTILTVKH